MPNVPKDDLDIRLSITETKVVSIEGDLVEHKVMLRDISTKVDGLKERFDKLNGALPHIQKTCGNIEKHLEAVTKANNSQENKITKNSLYIKILWGIVIPVSLTIVGATVKLIFFAG